MAERTLRIVQVGAALTGIGRAWLSILQKLPEWELVGVVDVVPEHRAAAIESAQLPADRAFGSIVDAARAIEFDAVAVIAPSPLHTDLALQALQAGKHVIVEKPFGIDFEQARAVVAFAEQRGPQVMVDQNYRYLPDMLALRRAVQEETAGRPGFVNVTFNCDWPPRTYQAGMANTMLLEMAVHHLDSIRFVLGSDPLTISGRTWRPPWTRYAGDTWVAGAFTFPQEVHVLYNGSLEAPGAGEPWQGLWRIECERGALHLADLGSGFGLYLSRSPRTFELLESFGTPPDPGSGIPGALREFAAALHEGRRPRGDGRDNLYTLAMAFGLARSSAEGRIVDPQQEFFMGREIETR
jgi:predicted dehydrogenase